jgi:sterol 3beta-glucosyltransferase
MPRWLYNRQGIQYGGRVRVLIITSGSTGDVAPYTGVAAYLRDAGLEVTLATHEAFRELATRAGVAFEPIPGDLRAVLPQAHGQDGTSSGTDPRALLKLMSLARPHIEALAGGMARVTDRVRPDALLLSTLVAPLGYQLAEAYGIPAAGLFPQPLHPTRAFGSVLVGGRSFGAWGNLAFGHLVDAAARTMYTRAVRDLRRSLGLRSRSLRTLEHAQVAGHPTFHGFSEAVVPRPADWPPQLRVTGYWWPARPADWQPSNELTAFLAAGPPPVQIGFGSMAPGQGSRLTEIVLDAVRRTGVRAILQAGWSGLATAPPAPEAWGFPLTQTAALPTQPPHPQAWGIPPTQTAALPTQLDEDVLSVGEVPHEWLFPQVAAVVHHAGAGTTAAALRAGVPAIAVPVLADQPFWARRLHVLGVAPRPVPMSSLTADRLAASIRAVGNDPHYAARAKAVSARIRAEDGVREILEWLRRTEAGAAPES